MSVLGPSSVEGDETSLAPRDRVVLAALAMCPQEPVSADRLADALWGESPPATWHKVIQGSVMRIRKVLGAQSVRTTGHGYVLALPVEEIDAVRFERQVRRSRELLELGDPDRARFTLTRALELWHGTALADLEDWEPGMAAAERLEELRREAEELRAEAALQAGGWREVLADAAGLVSDQPYRERRWALLARAQYQAGRQGEALATLKRARAVLVGELGLDPGPELVDLERAILHQDPALLPAPDDTPSGSEPPVCPYRGLLPYDLGDAEEYFGRDDDVAACRATLDRQGVLAVVGPSGSGKSSLVRAGVAAGLRRDGRPVTVLTPGASPTAALAAAEVLRTSTVLVVDQAEEVVTVCPDARDRGAFLDAVVGHADAGAAVVLALRADQLGALTAHHGFARLVERGLHLLGAMGEADLRAAIEGPARQAGLLLEAGLVDLLVEEASGRPGALPLLSHALAQTWENREGRTLTVAGYRATGGIRGAVAQSAEELHQRLPADEQQALRDLLLRLVAVGPDGQAVRSPVPRRVLAGDAILASAVEALTSARLVTGDEEVVELAHESLIGAWPRLRSWLDEDLEGQAILRHLTVAAASWEALGRPGSELYRGTRLARALDWQAHTNAELAPIEQAFLTAGRDLADAESRSAEQRLDEQRRANKRLRTLLVGLVGLLVLALVAGALAVRERGRAEEQARLAQVRELATAARGATGTDPELGMLLALQAVGLAEQGGAGPAREAVEALHEAVAASRIDLVVEDLGGNVAWSADGDLFVTEGPEDTGLVDLRDAETGESVRSFVGHDIDINEVAFSPDGLLATTGDDGALRVWDPEDGRLVSEVVGRGEVWGPSFSPDSGRLSASWVHEETVRVVEVATGEILVETRIPPGALSTSFSADGRSVAVAPYGRREALVLDAATGERTRTLDGHDNIVTVVRYSPDRRWLVTSAEDDSVQVRDAGTGRTVHRLDDIRSLVTGVAWSPDSELLAVGGLEGAARVFEISDSSVEEVFALVSGATPTPVSLAFSPDGKRLLGGDATMSAATVWDLGGGGGAEVANLPGHPGPWSDLAYTADGHLAMTDEKGTVTIWDAATSTMVDRLDPASSRTAEDGGSLAISPDGTLLAAGDRTRVRVWDLGTGREVFTKAQRDGSRLSFSPDSDLLAVSDGGRTIGLYGRDGGMTGLLIADEDRRLWDPTFSPDGTTVAILEAELRSNSPHGRLLLWTWREKTTVPWDEATGHRFAYAPDGSRLTLTDLAGRAEIWDTGAAERLRGFTAHTAGITEVAYSPDGGRLATAALDGTVRVWDADTGEPDLRLPSLPGEVTGLAFSPDGNHLAAGSSSGGLVRVWTLDIDELVSIAQDKVTRGLTPDECREYLRSNRCS